MLFAGCSAEDYAREEGLAPKPANEYAAERLLEDLRSAISGGDYADACTYFTPALRRGTAENLGSCRAAMEQINDEGFGSTEVVSSNDEGRGLWVETDSGVRFLIVGQRVADIEVPGE